MLCQTTPLFELDDDTNHFSCYTSKNISKAEQQLRKSSGICYHEFP